VLIECSYTHNEESCSALKLGNFFGRTLYRLMFIHTHVWMMNHWSMIPWASASERSPFTSVGWTDHGGMGSVDRDATAVVRRSVHLLCCCSGKVHALGALYTTYTLCEDRNEDVICFFWYKLSFCMSSIFICIYWLLFCHALTKWSTLVHYQHTKISCGFSVMSCHGVSINRSLATIRKCANRMIYVSENDNCHCADTIKVAIKVVGRNALRKREALRRPRKTDRMCAVHLTALATEAFSNRNSATVWNLWIGVIQPSAMPSLRLVLSTT